ncbi:hypothetical protein BCR32DRAFT_42456 [Anaeromyces robustus]|uniref:Uncharacterized protein n=1 Tax=Anaeromyces robustus TaxID=1754192 RepID=A0A1Y1WZ09_9FUNG|nr:hypothetical protein BCR32DRAFT_42456 [Anaeromyces robustus]|eukprot:ORX78817.1 hypothetical protein BCR32DRAFT_42456 [Anaeromyces robustus]
MDTFNTSAIGNFIQQNEKNINNLYERAVENAFNSKKQEIMFGHTKMKNSQMKNQINYKIENNKFQFSQELDEKTKEFINEDKKQLKLLSEIQSQMQTLQTEFINEQHSNIQEQV